MRLFIVTAILLAAGAILIPNASAVEQCGENGRPPADWERHCIGVSKSGDMVCYYESTSTGTWDANGNQVTESSSYEAECVDPLNPTNRNDP